MKPQSAKQKGKLLEDFVADSIIAQGLDDKARRDGASGAGSREKGDICTSMKINGQNVGIECKNHKNTKMRAWWLQVKKLEKLGREPVLVYKIQGEALSEAKAVIYLDTFLSLIKNQTDGDFTDQVGIDYNDKYIVKNAIDDLKKTLKILEKLEKNT